MYRYIFAGLVLLVLSPGPSTADDTDPLTIRNLDASVRDGSVYLDIEAENVVDARSLERLQSGIPVEIEYQVEIRQRRRGWFDDARGTARIQLQTVYDAVTREYTVTRRLNDELFDVKSARNVDDLEPILARLDQFPVLHVADTDLGQEPELRVRVVSDRRSWKWLVPRRIAGDWSSIPLIVDPPAPATTST